MSYTVPDARLGAIREVLHALHGASRVILTTHVNADGDGAGTEVALATHLRERGAEAWIVNPTPFPRLYEFLLPDPGWVLPVTDEEAASRCRDADLAVVVDTGEKSRIGRVNPLISSLPKVVVDHHPPGGDSFEAVSLRDPGACATGELAYDLLRVAGGPWPPAVIRGLYVAILTDTGGFRHSNTTPACHRIVADLIELGVDPNRVHRNVYGEVPRRRLELLRESLAHLDVSEDGSVSWMVVPKEAFKRLDASPEDLEGLVDYPRSVAGVEVALLFRQIQGGAVKVSFRSNGDVDVNALARDFGGGGHVKASGAVVQDRLDAVVQAVVAATLEAVRSAGAVPVPDLGQELTPEE